MQTVFKVPMLYNNIMRSSGDTLAAQAKELEEKFFDLKTLLDAYNEEFKVGRMIQYP